MSSTRSGNTASRSISAADRRRRGARPFNPSGDCDLASRMRPEQVGEARPLEEKQRVLGDFGALRRFEREVLGDARRAGGAQVLRELRKLFHQRMGEASGLARLGAGARLPLRTGAARRAMGRALVLCAPGRVWRRARRVARKLAAPARPDRFRRRGRVGVAPYLLLRRPRRLRRRQQLREPGVNEPMPAVRRRREGALEPAMTRRCAARVIAT